MLSHQKLGMNQVMNLRNEPRKNADHDIEYMGEYNPISYGYRTPRAAVGPPGTSRSLTIPTRIAPTLTHLEPSAFTTTLPLLQHFYLGSKDPITIRASKTKNKLQYSRFGSNKTNQELFKQLPNKPPPSRSRTPVHTHSLYIQQPLHADMPEG